MKKGTLDGIKMWGPTGCMVGFQPPWWRLDRWLFWAWLIVFKPSVARGEVVLSSIGPRGRIVERRVRAHAETW